MSPPAAIAPYNHHVLAATRADPGLRASWTVVSIFLPATCWLKGVSVLGAVCRGVVLTWPPAFSAASTFAWYAATSCSSPGRFSVPFRSVRSFVLPPA